MPQIPINGLAFTYDRDPDECPICHHGIQASNIGSNLVSRSDLDGGNTVQILYRCPRHECQRAFIASYTQNRDHRTHYPRGDFYLRSCAPYRPVDPDTADELKDLSPNYHKVLAQSFAAEGLQLDQIAGCGYRKALEFLIKDYAIHKHPDDGGAIKRKLLGACINEYCSDANVKACASRAAWILNEMLTEKYLREME